VGQAEPIEIEFEMKPPSPSRLFLPESEELQRFHEDRVAMLETMTGPVVALPTKYPDGYFVPRHSHSRARSSCVLRKVWFWSRRMPGAG